jgi:formylglycine-generating enzyme required for sulfatase activity
MADTHTRSARTWWIAAVLAGAAVLVGPLQWGWWRALWVYPSLSEDQRIEGFNDALVARRNGRGVTARLERGGLAILARSDVAQVGASQCARESECPAPFSIGASYRRAPLGCFYVRVTFSCAYAIRTTDGDAATAFVQFESNPRYEVGVSAPGSAKPLEVEEPRFHMLDDPGFREASENLCRLGFGCRPAAGSGPGAQARASARKAAEPPAAPPPEMANCDGARAEVVGKGATCLDPADPARREFQDCHNGFCGPTMVVLPKGSSVRGSSAPDIARLRKDDPRAQADSFKNETPQHTVTIGYQVAVGKFEVTFDQWDACLADGGCKLRPEDPANRARGARPVVHVSWNDVSNEFLPWLNRKLGLSDASAYRLLTEAEWEYAARAGTTTKYAFGDIISTLQARFDGDPVEVGSFAPNVFGLHDMHGNVPEWVQDCYQNGYDDAPVDGSAHTPHNCGSRVHRGGSWHDVPSFLRSAYRGANDPRDRSGEGFRVARTLVTH